mgnify:CR=1 FL=1|jgi:hypothetical protein
MNRENLIKSEVLTVRCSTVVKNKYVEEAKQLDMTLSNYLLYQITSQSEKALEVEQLKEVVNDLKKDIEAKDLLIEELKVELENKNISSSSQSNGVKIGFFDTGDSV